MSTNPAPAPSGPLKKGAVSNYRYSGYRYLLLFIVLASGAISYFSLRTGHEWGGDFALYLNQARGIVDGGLEELRARNTFSMLNSTATTGPNLRIGPFLYPWGLPLLLAPVYALFGNDIQIMKVYGILYLVLSMWVTYYLFLRKLGPTRSLWIVALLAFNPLMVQLVDAVGSDVPYHMFALLSMLFIQKMLSRRYWLNPAATALLTGLLICFAFLIRTNGIMLLGTLFFSQFIKYRTKLASPVAFLKQYPQELLPYASFVLGALVVSLALPSGSDSHFDFFTRLTPGKFAYNVMYYFELPSDFYTGALFPKIAYGLTLPFLLLGVYHKSHKDYHYVIYSVLSLAIFILWPPVQGFRFIVSLVPFYLYFVFVGFAHAETLYRKAMGYAGKPDRWLVNTFCSIILIQFLFSASTVALANAKSPQASDDGPYTKTSQQVFDYVNQQTTEAAVIVFFKPRVMDLMTRRLSLRVFSYDEIVNEKGDYLVYKKGQDFGQITPDEVARLQERLPTVLENDDFVVIDLRRLREDRPAKGPD